MVIVGDKETYLCLFICDNLEIPLASKDKVSEENLLAV